MKPTLWIVPSALLLVAACGGEADSGYGSSGATAEEAAEPVDEEPLPTPEEAAAEAEQSIDESNADAELERLQQELGEG